MASTFALASTSAVASPTPRGDARRLKATVMHGRNVNNVSSGGVGRRGRSSSLALQSGHRRAALRRLAVVVNAAATDDADDDDVNPRSNYTETPGAVKGLVSGLTAVVNAIGGSAGDENNGATRRERREARAPPSSPRDQAALRDDIALEFTEAKYLWTGDITPEMYDLFCTFTDPTLSFAGLDTFTNNLANLQPILRRLVRNSDVELYSCRLLGDAEEGTGATVSASGGGVEPGVRTDGDGSGGGGRSDGEGGGKVRASWRMTGNLRLPWRPRIDLCGQTTFTFKDWGARRGCLITAYQEEWELSAAEAVLQLVKPFQW